MANKHDIFEKLDIENINNNIIGNSEEVELKTGIDPLFFAETMTTDVELVDAIFDLIDNSIDAARNNIISSEEYSKDDIGLPNNYSNYEIKIAFSSDRIAIADNCLGIDSKSIEDRAFYTGKKSSHKFGIGYYGLGLKRAFLKAGKSFSIQSDNGKELYVADFSYDMLSGNKEKVLKAKKYPSQNILGTIFSVKDLKSDVVDQIGNIEWLEGFMQYLSIRYSIFIEKGLKLSIRSASIFGENFIYIKPGLPTIKKKGIVPEFKEKLVCDDVSVYFNVGVHHKYLFPGEYHSNPAQNKKLTDSYGIYIICNDRVIVANSFDKKYGFMTSPHSEYNGFLCYVRMVSENPADLPWNTTKTEIKVYSPLFIEAKRPIESLASKYRSKAKSVIKAWRTEDAKEIPEEEKRKGFYKQFGFAADSNFLEKSEDYYIQEKLFEDDNGTKVKPNEKQTNTAKENRKKKPKPRPVSDLQRDRNIFVNWDNCNVSVPEYRKKEYEIFSDMCRLSSKDTPIACIVMLRVFLETSVKQVIISMNLKQDKLSNSTTRVVEGLHKTDYISDGVKEVIKQYSNPHSGLFSIKNIQSLVHSTSFHPNKSMVNTYWDELEPFLAACWKFIRDNEQEQA